MSLTRKCPVCNSDALLQDAKPVFSEGFYSKIYKCEKGHVYQIKTFFKGTKKTVVEVLDGEEDESV